MLQPAGTGPMKCAALCPKGILVGRVVDQTNRAVKHAQALFPFSLSSVDIPYLFIICESTPSSGAWISESRPRGVEYCRGLCILRYGRIDYSILVCGRKPKTLGGAQGLH